MNHSELYLEGDESGLEYKIHDYYGELTTMYKCRLYVASRRAETETKKNAMIEIQRQIPVCGYLSYRLALGITINPIALNYKNA